MQEIVETQSLSAERLRPPWLGVEGWCNHLNCNTHMVPNVPVPYGTLSLNRWLCFGLGLAENSCDSIFVA